MNETPPVLFHFKLNSAGSDVSRNRREGSFEDLLKKAEHGAKILMFEEACEQWDMQFDSNDLYYSYLGRIYCNSELFLEGITETWSAYTGGIILHEENRLVNAKTKEVVYEGEYHDVMSGEKLIIKKGDELLIDGIPVYKSDRILRFTAHPKGFIVETGYRNRSALLLNGHKTIISSKKLDWEPHKDGVVTYRDHTFFLNDVYPLFSDWQDGWLTHRHGLIMKQGDKIYFVVLKKP